ncbi:rhodanese-like domain-containing protein [Algoriphagus winogradskyi]|jgi:rhodanese-related sulfurtransferase|uniref:Rhodanese-related sulfurtransferase n=1 Tax=Algoriphagus winogradskyi TaxID=237017 RepID=A0ABY1ND79_9BACT|nr:rhodanese-like domain-containing protein [Algoriphagus winogradskyi]SMP06817.1 Rhodanese-related sulfurtransferase [Algoriphagus winogradskyi]
MKVLITPFFLALILVVSMWAISPKAHAQSIAYKVLLSTLYDPGFPVLKPDQIEDLNKYQVLDTREKEEFAVSHLEGANWVGYETFSMKKLASLDKNKPVLVYCTVGARSQEIGKKLKEAGFSEVYNLYGGLIEWANEERPIFHEGFPTNQVHTYSKSWGIWLNKGEKVY